MKPAFPERPFFVPPLKIASGGVDFLGLREVDLEIRDELFPGFNTRCQFIRPFSVMSWIYWKFYQLCKEQGIANPTGKDLRVFSEKVETLLTWGHRLKGVRGVPGTDANPPKGSKRVPLSFKVWGRKASSTSLMAPVQYGPAMKTDTGLNLLQPLPGGFYRTVGEGVNLAVALEKSLSHNPRFKLLNSLTQTTATEQEALDLFNSWSIETVTNEERRSFLRAFYDKNSEDSDSHIGKRSLALSFILATLKAAGQPLTIEQLGGAMFYCQLSKKHPLKIPKTYRTAHLLWVLLHVRQAQRLALEALFSWVESQILAGRRTRVAIAAAVAAELGKACTFLKPKRAVLGSAASFFKGANRLDDLLAMGISDPAYCILSQVDGLREQIYNEFESVVPRSLAILFLCKQYVDAFSVEGSMSSFLGLGGAERISLSYWKEFVGKRANVLPAEFISDVLEYLVVSQHLAVATRRYDGGTQRLRISIEEEGLSSITGDYWRPPVTDDKLSNAISLMSECNLVKFDRTTDQVSLPT